jgi:hypothetical protein
MPVKPHTNPVIPGRRPWLWICREMPWPRVSGDRVYSAGMIRALADSGIAVSVLGHEGPGREAGPEHAAIDWCGIAGGTRRAPWVALTEALPVTAGIHDTPAARRVLEELLVARRFDAVVFDQLGSGWALESVLASSERLRRRGHEQPALIYLAHNHERKVWADMAANASGSAIRRLAVRRNAHKVALLEKRLVLAADRVCCITAEDAKAFVSDGAARTPIVLTPGYDGAIAPPRRIDADTPRRVAMVGSFDWAIKQENLRMFLSRADPAFAAAGIHFDVVGRLPAALRAELEPGLRATTLHGFVDDPAPIFARSRMAVVPEMIGGGFKLKMLDYLFARMPVASITAAAAGLSAGLRATMILADDCPSLVNAIVSNIDDTDSLQARQVRAFESARAAYRWTDRGVALRDAVCGSAPQAHSRGPRTASSNGFPSRAASSRQVA